jgi:hypothetical protein
MRVYSQQHLIANDFKKYSTVYVITGYGGHFVIVRLAQFVLHLFVVLVELSVMLLVQLRSRRSGRMLKNQLAARCVVAVLRPYESKFPKIF